MRFSTFAALAAYVSVAVAAPSLNYFSGFNLGANRPDGSCKSQADWRAELETIRSWDGGRFNHVKIFSTNDCDAVNQLVPVARSLNFKIHATIWSSDDKFGAEKGALERAMRAHGSDWLAGVTVGSEALYRNEINPHVLAERIWDVKGMVQIALGGPNVPVGTSDTWTAWENSNSDPVVDASDFIYMNGFPYWQGATAEQGLQALQTAIGVTRAQANNKPLIVGETGWPTAGANFGNAVPSVRNAEIYYKAAECWLKNSGIPHFWFSGFDEPQKAAGVEQNFGVAYSNRQLKYSLNC